MKTETNNKKVDVWHRDFCSWMRKPIIGWALYYALFALFVSWSCLQVFFAFNTSWLLQTSAWLGLHPSFLYGLAIISMIGIVSNTIIAISLPRLRSSEPTGWIFSLGSILSLRLSSMLIYYVKLEEPDKAWRADWWLQTSVILLLNLAVIFIAGLFSINIIKKREVDYWPWERNTDGL